ncbi:hypothetical protein MHK_009826 [Candidatus Magnetomorum sp. HK-1]|nr:hypothetical protein MHK_009826 [Candidatus Magnetomorum sp. HK-1]
MHYVRNNNFSKVLLRIFQRNNESKKAKLMKLKGYNKYEVVTFKFNKFSWFVTIQKDLINNIIIQLCFVMAQSLPCMKNLIF